MKKKIAKALAEMCKELPVVKKPVKKGFTGSQMLEAGHEKDSAGHKISDKKKYTMVISEPVNHFSICKNLFKSGGIEAVRNYCNSLLGNRPILAEKISELREAEEKLNQELKNLNNESEKDEIISIEIDGSTTIDALPVVNGEA